MNQHFRAAAVGSVADDAVVPAQLQIATKWIEGLVIKRIRAFSDVEAFFLPARLRERAIVDEWLIESVAIGSETSVFVETKNSFNDDWPINFVAVGPETSVETKDSLPIETRPEQAVLDFPNVFLPSARLVALWIDGLAEFAKSGDRKDVDKTVLKLSVSERSEALVKRVSYIVALYAHQRKYEDELKFLPLTAENRFDLSFQLVLSEFLPLVPDRSDEFLSLLHDELGRAFKAGWSLESDEWGEVQLTGDDIVIQLRKPTTFEDPDFELSTEG